MYYPLPVHFNYASLLHKRYPRLYVVPPTDQAPLKTWQLYFKIRTRVREITSTRA